MRLARPIVIGVLLSCAANAVAQAAPPPATFEAPLGLPENPFAIAGSTEGAPSLVDAYDCAPGVDESGPERAYVVDAPAAGRLTAWIEGDGGGVDVDVHLVVGGALSGGTLSGCLARGNQIAEALVPAGPVLVVVDSYGGVEQAGGFVLRTTWIGDAWTESEPYEGVVWRAKRYADYAGGPQVVHELLVDPLNPALRIEAHRSSGCQTIGAMAAQLGAVAAINGGYFTTGCAPVSLLKHEGNLLGTNAVARSAFGLSAAGDPLVALVGVGADWPAASEAHGGGPRLVAGGTALTSNADYAAEGISSASFIAANPRTIAGIRGDGRVSLVGVDGRRDTARGMSLPQLATWSVALGHVDTVNLDGGGSTTVWLRDATPNGVVNYPSDAGDVETAAHGGSRGVSGGFFVFSEPKKHAPIITTLPPLSTALGADYAYDVDAYDRNPLDVLSHALVVAPEGMTIDPANGELRWSVPSDAAALVAVTVVVSDGELETEQSFELSVEGGAPSGAGGASGSGGAGVGGEAGGGEGGGAGAANAAAGGCGCAVVGARAASPSAGLVAAALALAGLVARRRRP